MPSKGLKNSQYQNYCSQYHVSYFRHFRKFKYVSWFCVLRLILLKESQFFNIVMSEFYLIQTSLFYVTNENIDGNCQVCRWETLGSMLFSLFMIIISFFYRICSESLRGKKPCFFSDFEFFFNFKIKECHNLVTTILNVKWCQNLVNKQVSNGILPNIWQSKGNQRIKFGKVMEYNKRNLFLQKLCRKWGRETWSRLPFFFKKKLYMR